MELYLCQNISRREDAYSLLAYAVRHRWGLNKLPAIARTPKGKPHFPDHPDFHFNLSHSIHYALCALDEHPVGTDIEVIRPHHPHLSHRICSAEELAWLEGQEDSLSALCQLWTRKEALVKYHGTGLTVPLRSIRIPLPPAGELDSLLFHAVTTAEFCLCACGHTAAERIVFLTWEEILR